MSILSRIKKLFYKPKNLEELIADRVKQGESLEKIRGDLLRDLAEGGKIFGDFRKAIEPTFPNSKNRFKDNGEFEEWISKNEEDRDYVWSAVLINTCPDCLERHGKNKTMKEWSELGLPRSGKTQCKKECKCVLSPSYVTKLQKRLLSVSESQ